MKKNQRSIKLAIFTIFAIRIASLAVPSVSMADELSPAKDTATATPIEQIEGIQRGKIVRDLVYATVDGEELKLDLVLPEKSERPAACVVVIHGGAWRSGNKQSHHDELRGLAADGYAAATIAYRFCPEHRFPAQVHDVKRAVQFLRSNAKAYHIDPERFGAMGFSAGAHLSMMLGTVDPPDGLEPNKTEDSDATKQPVSSKVQAVVSYFGPTDFTRENIPAPSVPLLSDFIGGPISEMGETYRAASPINYLDQLDAAILLFQGTKDPLVPFDQAVLMGEKMTEVGVAGRVELLIGQGHGWGNPHRNHTIEQTRAFFARHLR